MEMDVFRTCLLIYFFLERLKSIWLLFFVSRNNFLILKRFGGRPDKGSSFDEGETLASLYYWAAVNLAFTY